MAAAEGGRGNRGKDENAGGRGGESGEKRAFALKTRTVKFSYPAGERGFCAARARRTNLGPLTREARGARAHSAGAAASL